MPNKPSRKRPSAKTRSAAPKRKRPAAKTRGPSAETGARQAFTVTGTELRNHEALFVHLWASSPQDAVQRFSKFMQSGIHADEWDMGVLFRGHLDQAIYGTHSGAAFHDLTRR